MLGGSKFVRYIVCDPLRLVKRVNKLLVFKDVFACFLKNSQYFSLYLRFLGPEDQILLLEPILLLFLL